jgi:mRNA interferase MazF
LVVAQGDVWWAGLPIPGGSEPGFRRPVLVVQGDTFNRSRIATVVCVALTSNLKWRDAPGNVYLDAGLTGLPKDSVVNVSAIVTLDKSALTECAGRLPPNKLQLVLAGIDIVLGRDVDVSPASQRRHPRRLL